MAVLQYPEVIAGAYILNPDNELLLVNGPKWKAGWMVPGGHVEYGENVLATAAREAKEEVGLDVVPLGVIAVIEDLFPKSFHKRKHFIYIEVLCSSNGRKVRIDGNEIKGYRWFRPSEALKAVEERSIKKVIKILINRKNLRFIDIKASYSD